MGAHRLLPDGAPPPIAIVGTTASGKSSLAMALARHRGDVELVSVDSMQVYRGFDIGTAKPTPSERAAVAHHLLDLLDPNEECSVAWFQERSRAAVAEIVARDHRPLFVGGTGLYHRAVVDDLSIPPEAPEVRLRLDALDTDELVARLGRLDPAALRRIDPSNRRRLLRALEVCESTGQPFSSFGPGLDVYASTPHRLVGLRVDRGALATRIRMRVTAMLDAGWLDEVAGLTERGPWSRTAAQAIGYRELAEHLAGRSSLAEAVDATVQRTRRFAVRQMRWFARDPRIVWFDAESPSIVDQVADTVCT